MKSDDGNARTGLESRSQNTQTVFERTKLVIHFHAQRLKDLGGRMTPTVPADKAFDRTRQRESFAERACLAHLYDQARDPARSRFLSQFAKQSGQLFSAVLIYNSRRSKLVPRIHAHVERTAADQAKAALRVFELSGRDTKIKKRATDGANSKLIENLRRVPKIHVAYRDAPAEACQLRAHMLDCIGVLIQGQNIGTASQKRFSVATTATGCIDDERTWLRLEQLYHFPLEHWTMINKILHFVGLLFGHERISGKPDRPLKQQCIHNV